MSVLSLSFRICWCVLTWQAQRRPTMGYMGSVQTDIHETDEGHTD